MNPLTGKLRFQLRTLTNCLLVLVIFLPLAFIAAFLPFVLLADAVIIALLFYLYFFILNKRAIWVRCSHCRKRVATNTPWICGFCKERNQQVDEYPFVYRCEHCSAEPKAYKCHHWGCGELIFFTEDQLEKNYAMCVNSPVEKVPVPETEAARFQREKQMLSHEIEMLDLEGKLEAVKQRRDLGKKKSPVEEMEESFSQHFTRALGAHEYARKQKTANAEKFKDDPEMLEKANQVVDDWLEHRL
jgi:hypothetical protein